MGKIEKLINKLDSALVEQGKLIERIERHANSKEAKHLVRLLKTRQSKISDRFGAFYRENHGFKAILGKLLDTLRSDKGK